MAIVAAGDEEPEIAEQLIASEGVDPQSSPTVPMQQQQEAMKSNWFSKEICYECNKKFPPARKFKRQKVFAWVQCDSCPRWYHKACVGVQGDDVVCPMCCKVH